MESKTQSVINTMKGKVGTKSNMLCFHHLTYTRIVIESPTTLKVLIDIGVDIPAT